MRLVYCGWTIQVLHLRDLGDPFPELGDTELVLTWPVSHSGP